MNIGGVAWKRDAARFGYTCPSWGTPHNMRRKPKPELPG